MLAGRFDAAFLALPRCKAIGPCLCPCAGWWHVGGDRDGAGTQGAGLRLDAPPLPSGYHLQRVYVIMKNLCC